MEPLIKLRSFTNELRLYEDHLEGEFFGEDIVAAFGNRFYSLKYQEVLSVNITESPDRYMILLEIDFAEKPEFEKKHLHPSNLFFRKSRKEEVKNCLLAKAIIDYLRQNPFDSAAINRILSPENEEFLDQFSSEFSFLKRRKPFSANFSFF